MAGGSLSVKSGSNIPCFHDSSSNPFFCLVAGWRWLLVGARGVHLVAPGGVILEHLDCFFRGGQLKAFQSPSGD